jgi:hypothetical protein
MTYDPNQPENLPPPKSGISSVKDNFNVYDSVFDNNHEVLNSSNQGKHTNVIIQQQGSDPTVEGSFDTLYGKSVTSNSSTSQELFARIPQFLPVDKPNIPTQMTFNSVNTAGPVYQSFMAGEYIVYFGQTTNIAVPITLSPAPSEILCVIANSNSFTNIGTPVPNDVGVVVNANNFQFTITSLSATNPYLFTFYVIARQ